MSKKATENVQMKDVNAEIFNIPILETVKAAQLQNGLRHRDFQRYRQYCSRRLRRIRTSVKFMHGKGKLYVNKKVDAETATEARLLYLPLYNAERAWSYAMQLKEDDNLEQAEYGEDANSRIKFHLHGRLRKAAEWSQRLATICSTKADARTSLEAEAYAAFMTGNFHFHREEHEESLDRFTTARRIYTDLAKVGTLAQKELFQNFIEELEPFIRFSEHRLALTNKNNKSKSTANAMAVDWSATDSTNEAVGASNSLLQSKIDRVLLEARKQKAAELKTVTWKKKEIALPTQEITMAFVKPDEIVVKLEKTSGEKKKESVYLELLSAYDTLLQLIRNEIHKYEQQVKSGSSLATSQMESLQLLEEFVRFRKLVKQVDHTLNLFKQLRTQSSTKPNDLLHIIDMIVKNVEEILAMPQIDVEKNIWTRYTAYGSCLKALRSAQVAQVYLGEKKFSETIALYQRAGNFLIEAEETLASTPAAKDENLQALVTEIGDEVKGASSRVTAQAFLDTSKKTDAVRNQLQQLKLSGAAGVKKAKSLLERQHEYNAGTSEGLYEVVALPPAFKAVACKPLLFDVAFSELEFPDITERTKTEEEKKAEAAASSSTGSGFFGWLRGGN